MEKQKTITTIGKRKTSIAKATVRKGNGIIRINSLLLSCYEPEIARLKVSEPLEIAGPEIIKTLNININVNGGGWQSQVEAARLAIARGLVKFTKSKKLKQDFLNYDKALIVADIRRKEPYKPNDSKARKARQFSKR
jgi:small subunit ribosomal protein S9